MGEEEAIEKFCPRQEYERRGIIDGSGGMMRGRETCSQLRGKFWYGTCFQNREQVGWDEREHVGEIKMAR